MRNKLMLLVLAVSSTIPVTAQQKFSLYVLCVGSGHYTADFSRYEPGFNGFSPLPAAIASARQMHQQFRSFGTVYSDTLISKPNRLVSRQAVFTAIDRMVARARSDRKPNPLLVFYYCGHGISEGFGWNLFLIPGDFRYRINGKDAVRLGEQSLYAGTVMDKLESAQLPVLALLDCCYEGDAEVIRTQDYAYQQSLLKIAELAKDVQAIVRKMNEFNDSNPVIFSTHPGELTKAVGMQIGGVKITVGPLCRRTLLAAQNSNSSLTLDSFIHQLTAPQLAAQPDDKALTNWDRENSAFKANHIR